MFLRLHIFPFTVPRCDSLTAPQGMQPDVRSPGLDAQLSVPLLHMAKCILQADTAVPIPNHDDRRLTLLT